MLWITSSLFYFNALLYQTYLRVQRHLVTQNLGWCYIDIAAAVWITPVITKREHLRFPWCISSLSSGEHHLGSHGSKLAWNSGKRTGNMYTNSAHDILAIWCLERNTPGELGQYLTLWLQVINTMVFTMKIRVLFSSTLNISAACAILYRILAYVYYVMFRTTWVKAIWMHSARPAVSILTFKAAHFDFTTLNYSYRNASQLHIRSLIILFWRWSNVHMNRSRCNKHRLSNRPLIWPCL